MKINTTFFNLVRKKVIDSHDRQLACDYIDWYSIEPEEYGEYADEFVSVCYKFNEETGEHEPRNADELPFANITETDDGIMYEYDGQCIIKIK